MSAEKVLVDRVNEVEAEMRELQADNYKLKEENKEFQKDCDDWGMVADDLQKDIDNLNERIIELKEKNKELNDAYELYSAFFAYLGIKHKIETGSDLVIEQTDIVPMLTEKGYDYGFELTKDHFKVKVFSKNDEESTDEKVKQFLFEFYCKMTGILPDLIGLSDDEIVKFVAKKTAEFECPICGGNLIYGDKFESVKCPCGAINVEVPK